jgi:hypothetical protein
MPSELNRCLNIIYLRTHCSEFSPTHIDVFSPSHCCLSSLSSTMLTSRGVTRLSRRAVNSVKRTNALFSTSAPPILARAALSVPAGTQSSLRPTRFASSTPGEPPFLSKDHPDFFLSSLHSPSKSWLTRHSPLSTLIRDRVKSSCWPCQDSDWCCRRCSVRV